MSGLSLDLTINVPADEWAFCQRRLTYLETLLLRLVRDRRSIQEWYDAEELAALRLPGLPGTGRAVARKATAARWHRRWSDGGQRRYVYHVTSLPARAFDALIARILDLPEMAIENETISFSIADTACAPPEPAAIDPTTAPAWVLPLMRLLRGSGGDLGVAWRELPEHLPRGVALPTTEEAAMVLVSLGLHRRHPGQDGCAVFK